MVDGGELTIGDNTKIIYENNTQPFDIRSGSTIKFGKDAGIVMKGKINALGTASDPIRFTSNLSNPGASDFWDSIQLENGSSAFFDHTLFEHTFTGVVANLSATDSLYITNSQMYSATIEVNNGSHAIFENCDFFWGGIESHSSQLQIENSRFFDNANISLTDDNSLVKNNFIISGGDLTAVRILGSGTNPGTRIINNTIVNFINGISNHSASQTVVKQNIFYLLKSLDMSVGEATYNLFYGTASFPSGVGNLEGDPLFIDPANNDFQLSYTSPAIDAGDPSESNDPDGTIADLGASYYHQEQISGEINYAAGWRTTSLPIGRSPVAEADLSDANPNTLFSFDGVYTQEDSMAVGKGYWVNFSQNGSESLENGDAISALALDLKAGWSIIPGISESIPVDNIVDPDGLINSPIYGWEGSYVAAEHLEPGKGYWINLSSAGRIVLAEAPGAISKNQNKFSAPDSTNWLRITNAAGKEFTLYFGQQMSQEALQYLKLPPVPLPLHQKLDSEGLDVRFREDDFETGKDQFIEIRTAAFPLNIEYQLTDSVQWVLRPVLNKSNGGSLSQAQKLSPGQRGTFMIHATVEGFMLSQSEGNKSEELPKAFTLHSNYPNPFNPSTTIRYQIPQTSRVRLAIYNTLGELIRVLVDQTISSGSHEVTWNGKNDHHHMAASGIYILKMTGNDGRRQFTDSRKIILMK